MAASTLYLIVVLAATYGSAEAENDTEENQNHGSAGFSFGGSMGFSRTPEVYCPASITPKHTCQQSLPPWDTDNYCHCDDLCASYGDCCPDADRWSGKNDTGPGDAHTPDDSTTGCVQTLAFDPAGHDPRRGHYMVAACPSDQSGSPTVRALCLGPAGSDGLATIPVQDSRPSGTGTGGRHYKNVYCAVCHGVPLGAVRFWSVTHGDDTRAGINESDVLGHLADGSEGASLTFRPPGGVGPGGPRACSVVDPTDCRPGNPDLQLLCTEHFAPIAFGGVTYRNLACYRCSSSTTPELLARLANVSPCNGFPPPVVSSTPEPLVGGIEGQGQVSLGELLNFGPVPIEEASCGPNQIMDLSLGVCKDLTCPPGHVLENGVVCVPTGSSGTTGVASPNSIQVSLTIAGGGRGAPEPAGSTWETAVVEATEGYVSAVFACGELQHGVKGGQGAVECPDKNITWTCTTDAGDVGMPAVGACVGSDGLLVCSVNVSFPADVASVDDFIEGNERAMEQCFRGVMMNYTVRTDLFTAPTPCPTPPLNHSGRSIDEPETVSVLYVYDGDTGEFVASGNASCPTFDLDCPLLTIPRDGFRLSGALNESITLTQYDRVLPRGEFILTDTGEAQVCNFFQPLAVAAPMWNSVHFILTVSGSSLSLIGVLITVATYVAFPTLRRNAAGKSVMCLVAALFFAQLTMVVGLDSTEVFSLCVAFGVIAHYFWLSAFFWMNTLAIDIYRTFGIGTKINDPNTRSVRYYALYGLGAPALIVGTCLFLSFCDCVDFDVRYASESTCWIGGGMTNLVTFGVPVIAVLCSNAILFSLTVAGVMKTRRASEKMNVTQGQGGAASKSRSDLVLYLKLNCVMGFTWIFGFVASFTGIQFFWYPFIVLNSLQGALVCLAFVCNKRVLTMWKKKLTGGSGQRDSSSSFSSTRRPQMQQTSVRQISAIDVQAKTADENQE